MCLWLKDPIAVFAERELVIDDRFPLHTARDEGRGHRGRVAVIG